jgi:SAM-dependent methyltransferase
MVINGCHRTATSRTTSRTVTRLFVQLSGRVGAVESVNFDRAAGYYDATRALPTGAMRALTDLLAAELGQRQPCLEIGVGTGRFALPLRDRGIVLAGADISGAMLRQLVANAIGRRPPAVLQADAARLPAGAGTFGSVLAVHVLHLIPDWRVAVDEAVRVLRPGGALVASFPTDNRPARRPGGTRRPGNAQPGAPGQQRPPGTSAPWSAAVRAAAERHGMVRRPVGARDPQAVVDYLGTRAAARELAPVPVHAVTTLGQAIENIERQLFSWTWPYSAQQAAAVADEVRAWAEQEGLPLGTVHERETASRWWAFEVTGAR